MKTIINIFKVMSPPPNNEVVTITIAGSTRIFQLTSDTISAAEAAELKAILKQNLK
ncbi:MAG: hypothetical protein WC761_01160 [Candidatus Paceibacterota bacterium]